MSKNDLNKALGPLAGLFEDPDVNMVMVDGPQRVTIEKYDGVEETGITFESDEDRKSVV
jgi:Flp pilus assembly CpaF family ATPase